MGIERTDLWLKEDFDEPLELIKRLKHLFGELDEQEIYGYLQDFGMYKPNSSAKQTFREFEKENMWEKLKELYFIYRKVWSGPEVPIFLFPSSGNNGLFTRKAKRKSGVSFHDKMFIFLSEVDDIKEVEALFVHEYHHVCRLNKLNKKIEEYTLHDSMIMEGLAEQAVLKYCGKEYLAKWCNQYSEEQLTKWWETYLVSNLNCTRNEQIHDEILFGKNRYPDLLGYAIGFKLVRQYYLDQPFYAKKSFTIPSEKFIKI
jgi:uncharacterized protein YjaZ